MGEWLTILNHVVIYAPIITLQEIGVLSSVIIYSPVPMNMLKLYSPVLKPTNIRLCSSVWDWHGRIYGISGLTLTGHIYIFIISATSPTNISHVAHLYSSVRHPPASVQFPFALVNLAANTFCQCFALRLMPPHRLLPPLTVHAAPLLPICAVLPPLTTPSPVPPPPPLGRGVPASRPAAVQPRYFFLFLINVFRLFRVVFNIFRFSIGVVFSIFRLIRLILFS
jgi:hypothetical protein